MKKFFTLFIFISTAVVPLSFMLDIFPKPEPIAAQGPSRCVTDPINFVPNKKLLPLYDAIDANNECLQKTGFIYCGRGKQPVGGFGPSNDCYAPIKIVMHTTHGAEQTADDVFAYFNNGSEGRRVGAHFGIGRDGSIIQMVELGGSQVEYAQTVGGYRTHISIEMASPGDYGSKADAPAAQYQAALQLVKSLMQQYNIPVTDLSCRVSGSCPSVSSHKDLAPGFATDPGDGWMTDFLADLPNAQPLPGTGPGTGPGAGAGGTGASQVCITQVGTPGSPPPGPLGCPGGLGGVGMGNYAFPVNASVVTGVATEMAAYPGGGAYDGHREHAGLDIGTPINAHSPVFAVADGTVTSARSSCYVSPSTDARAGQYCRLEITHSGDNFISSYTHVNIDGAFRVDATVNKGQQIGVVHYWPQYSNMDHLHFELQDKTKPDALGSPININPRNYFPELQQFPPSGYGSTGNDVRQYTDSVGINWAPDGKEYAETFLNHPPCTWDPGGCWAH